MGIYWEHDGENMYIGLVSPGTGWVGLGLGPQGVPMEGANIIIGYVDDATGALTLTDFIGGERWQHESDTNRGGVDNIGEKSGTQSVDETIIEFIFPLSTGDVYDHNFEVGGTYGFFVSYHASADDLVSYHPVRSETISLRVGEPGELPPVEERVETVLTIEVPELVEQQNPFYINISLTDIDRTPLEGETIRFYLITTFGDLQIGESLTNAEGLAQLEYTHPNPEIIEIKAVLEETPVFEASQTIRIVWILSIEPPEEEFSGIILIPGTDIAIRLDVLILSLILIFVFGSIFVIYVRVLYYLYRVPKVKAPEEVRPTELRFEEIEMEHE